MSIFKINGNINYNKIFLNTQLAAFGQEVNIYKQTNTRLTAE